MKVIMVCPFCGEEHCVVETAEGYHCTSCEYDFTEDDFRHEILRQKISSICSGEDATEENPIDCTNGNTMLVIGDDEAQGLSELEKPQVTSVFQDYEAIVWCTIDGVVDAVELDELTTSDLENILNWLEGELGYNALGIMDKDGNIIDDNV